MTPKYEQLVQRLRAALPQWYADGQRKLPGEQALAAQLAVPVGTVKSRLFNARRMLCELLEKGVET